MARLAGGGDDGSIQVAYSAFWAGKDCDSVKVEAFYGLDENSLTGTVTLAESAIGEGVGVLQVPLDVEPLRYFVKLRFTSAAGECVTKVSSIEMPALYLPTLPAPIVDRQAMTIQFAGALSPLGFGTTTLSVEYGGTDALGHSLELGSADEADGSLEFSSDPIPCYHRIRTQRMKHVYYRYVYVITAGDRELMRTASEIRRVLVCNLATIFYVK